MPYLVADEKDQEGAMTVCATIDHPDVQNRLAIEAE